MKKLWNLISSFSLLYLAFIVINYVTVFIMSGAKDVITNASISGWELFAAVIALSIIIWHVIDKIVVVQLLEIRNRIEKTCNEMKRKSSK